jgi:type II restriction enzyme
MNLQMDVALAQGFQSRSQMVRVITESWASSSLYCAACLSNTLSQSPNNAQAVDFVCPDCQAPYQLKSGGKGLKDRIIDAGYHAMMAAIQADATPHLLVLHYTTGWQVQNLVMVPRFFFTASAIEKRKPLSLTARRAGYIGCNILLSAIADEGKLPLIVNGTPRSLVDVRAHYQKVTPLQQLNVTLRGWALDVFACLSRLGKRDFTLADVYLFQEHLAKLHPENNNIQPKIRQQLQVLRDAGIVEFVGRGHYRLKF